MEKGGHLSENLETPGHFSQMSAWVTNSPLKTVPVFQDQNPENKSRTAEHSSRVAE
jgi:hypothetical protein